MSLRGRNWEFRHKDELQTSLGTCDRKDCEPLTWNKRSELTGTPFLCAKNYMSLVT